MVKPKDRLMERKKAVIKKYAKGKTGRRCPTRFYKENRMHLTCAPGSIYTHMIDIRV
jgi:hypothetical protein